VLGTGAVHDPATQASLLALRAYALYYLNHYEEAFETATRAVACAEPIDDPRLLARTLLVLSKSAFWARGPHAARPATERAVALLERCGDAEQLSAALADLARTHSNLATLGIVAEPSATSVEIGLRALALADDLDRDDLRCQALLYVGSGRLAEGDERGAEDLERAIVMGSGYPRLELAGRACVNAAGGAYRGGRPQDALQYVERGLRLTENGEFVGGEYRLRLTRAAVLTSLGRWDEAVAELRGLLVRRGEPAAMGSLASALLARLLARRGDADGAGRMLDALSARPPAGNDPFVAGPLAAAAVESAWLRGDRAAMPGLAAPALRISAATGHRGSRSELCRYLQRGGHAVEAPPGAIGPWVPALAGRSLAAAAAWHDLGERYEEAVELAGAAEPERSRGLRALDRLGAVATVAVLQGAERHAGAGPPGG
jgi:tetratricopeptide (TPR) repeat protein